MVQTEEIIEIASSVVPKPHVDEVRISYDMRENKTQIALHPLSLNFFLIKLLCLNSFKLLLDK